jgi:hypothetical protein
MSAKITGLDKLQKTLTDAQRALGELNGTITELKFDPKDPASVAAAIAEMERAVDAKVAPYRGNSIIEPLAAKSKEAFRKAIEERAAAARA